jgi:hypothetical protein
MWPKDNRNGDEICRCLAGASSAKVRPARNMMQRAFRYVQPEQPPAMSRRAFAALSAAAVVTATRQLRPPLLPALAVQSTALEDRVRTRWLIGAEINQNQTNCRSRC